VIIVQTPLRISFFGGGTDFPAYYRAEGGCVLSTAIDKYIYVTIKRRFDEKLRIGYTRTELVDSVGEVQHELIREALLCTGIQQGIEITTMGDIPAGSGLGTSSAVTVGSLHAMHAYQNELVTMDRLAQEACAIEIDRLGKPIGVQDQYIAAFGGLRFIEFLPDGRINCERVCLPPEKYRELDENLLLFFTGITREADGILTEQNHNVVDNRQILGEMKRIAVHARDEFMKGNLDALGPLLDESWTLKKQLASKITSQYLDEIYQAARQAGASGGKISGAGGGGFLLLFCRPGKRDAVRKALPNLREVPIRLEPGGSKVIFQLSSHAYS
jgi:D-glycero-alpha-D-manno-heptose-7-phosphate kinase